ncbi:MAG: PilZ domain-containing protein [Desulfobacterales bacterium]|jgi:c-di-GMP-binding flagellar brake protein YcgR
MAHFEIITGSAVTALLDTLIQHKTFLKLTLVDTEYESLARILRIADHNKTPSLVFNVPQGFEEAAADLDDWQIRFEFSGPDQIQYAFTAAGGEIADNRIHLSVPWEIERQQRRERFRIDAPEGTRIHFINDGKRLELEVINISIGGSLAAWVQSRTDMPQNSPLAVTQRFEDVKLVFPAEILQRPIQIEALEIKRIEQKSQHSRYELGIEFDEISDHEKMRLTDLIYELQRQYLRHRLPVDL